MLKHNVIQLIKICLLKAKPQDVQYSLITLYFIILTNLIIFIYSMGNAVGYIKGTIIASVFVAVLLVYIFLILKTFKLKSRFVQTASTILGCSALLIIFGFILSVCLLILLSLGVSGQLLSGLSKLLMLAIFFWSIFICGFIYKHALNKGWFIALTTAIIMLVFANSATIVVRQFMG